MIPVCDAQGRWLCFGIRARRGDERFVATPDVRGGVVRGELVNISKRHGFRLYSVEDDGEECHEAASMPKELFKAPLLVGDESVAVASHWYAREDGRFELWLVQKSDPRKNGMPVVSKVTGALVGMYAASSWFETQARVVPVDVMFGCERLEMVERAADVELEREWDAAREGPCVQVGRAMQIDGKFFAETRQGQCKWVGDDRHRRLVRENECRYLLNTFNEAIRALKLGSSCLSWSDGSVLSVQGDCRAFGFDLRDAEEEEEPKPPHKKRQFPCQPWI
jgi:hypothetical protein